MYFIHVCVCFQENDLDIPSYSIEILTIYIWSTKCEDNPGTDHLFREVMRQLATCGTLRVALDDNYKSSRYTRYIIITPKLSYHLS